MNEEKMTHARSLYMNEGKTQKEIAEIVGVSERTIYNWIKQFGWDKLKQAAFHAPAIIADNIFSQVAELQTSIAEREPGKRFPTLQEAEITRKLLCCLDKVKSATSLAQNMQMLESFTRFTRTKNEDISRMIRRYGEHYLEERAINGFKPYQMEYYPYNISPFSYFENAAPAEEQYAPVQNTTTPPKPAEEPTIMVHSDGSITEALSVPEVPETENTCHPERSRRAEKAAPAPIETIDSEADNLPEPTATDRKIPEISSNPDVTVSEVEPRQDTPEEIPEAAISYPAQTYVPVSEVELRSEEGNEDVSDEVPITMSSAYFITLPPHRRPSPFREGNIIWVNHPDDLENNQQYIKMSDTIRRYDELKR